MISPPDSPFAKKPELRCRVLVEIGPLTIEPREAGKVWLQHQSGEGGEFKAAALAQHIEQFFYREL